MSDLIDRQALRKAMFSYYPCVNEHSVKWNYCGDTLMDYEVADLIEDCIDNAPAVDAVEVVRCKDCKSHRELNRKDWLEGGFAEGVLWCMNQSDGVWPDDFCSYGKRREENAAD